MCKANELNKEEQEPLSLLEEQTDMWNTDFGHALGTSGHGHTAKEGFVPTVIIYIKNGQNNYKTWPNKQKTDGCNFWHIPC